MESKEEIIKSLSRKILRILNKHAQLEARPASVNEKVAVTHRELHTVQLIGEKEQVNVTDVASDFGVTKSAASQMISKLVKKGLVTKEAAFHSNRETRLSLSDLGWEAYEIHERIHGEHMAEVVKRLNVFSLSQIAATSVLLEVLEGVVDERLSEK